MRTMLYSKIHQARVTDVNLYYEGSITIARDIMEAADLLPYERVEVLNINSGARLRTYVIEGKAGSGEICINGPAARKAVKDDLVIILAYRSVPDEEARMLTPKLVYLNSSDNTIVRIGLLKEER
ncbi:aspartate 1-decarboxylase [Candidatus Bipolaricaulota bacterium]|nr:aspartate 1-decarboxylase [Candidatus Bipolaricaulota bacterium]HBR09912.1 aspartate 1-decarboxylase [Candidatus Acetothermia bacterium]